MIETTRYKKIPATVNAISVNEILQSTCRDDLPEWLVDLMELVGAPIITWNTEQVYLKTIQGQGVYANRGEWILQASDNQLDIWPIAGEVFEKSYELISEGE